MVYSKKLLALRGQSTQYTAYELAKMYWVILHVVPADQKVAKAWVTMTIVTWKVCTAT
jgi:DNA mismatch repair protein MutH